MSIRVVLADDHPVSIRGVRAVLEGTGVMTVAGEAHTPDALIALLRQVECDVVIMDYLMSRDEQTDGRDGLYLLRAIRRIYPDLPIVIFTMLSGQGLSDAVIDVGANAILCKRDPIDLLPTMLELVMSGHLLVRPQRPAASLSAPRSPFARDASRPSVARLSPRETEVVRLLMMGRSMRQVAAQLNRSAKTISNQKRSAMQKLGLSSDIELARFALDAGLG